MPATTVNEWVAWASSFDFGADRRPHYDGTIRRLVTYAGNTEARHETPERLKTWIDFMLNGGR
jgi:hypothetical protein